MGNSQFVTNCSITFIVKPYEKQREVVTLRDSNESLPKFIENKIKFDIPFLTTEEVWYIPMTNVYLETLSSNGAVVHRSYEVSKVIVEYTTPLLEKIKFVSDIDQKEERHLLITSEDKEQEIIKSKMQNVVWNNPKEI